MRKTIIQNKEKDIHKVPICQASYRIIPSHYPPIQLFENLLDPSELDAAYALEALTNDRIQDEVGNIALVAPKDRVAGVGSTPIMAAFTHIGVPSRFTAGRFGVYYAGLDLNTALIEAKMSRARFLKATNESAQTLTMRCYQCRIDAVVVDVRNDSKAHTPNDYTYSQTLGKSLREKGEMGILYRSVRNPSGECIAALKPTAMVPPANQAEHYQFHWNGTSIDLVSQILEDLA